jgi:hypothetical protein
VAEFSGVTAVVIGRVLCEAILALDPAATPAPIFQLGDRQAPKCGTIAAVHCVVEWAGNAIDDESHGSRSAGIALMSADRASKALRDGRRLIGLRGDLHLVLIDNRRTRGVGDIQREGVEGVSRAFEWLANHLQQPPIEQPHVAGERRSGVRRAGLRSGGGLGANLGRRCYRAHRCREL